jgi:hypothetical protein
MATHSGIKSWTIDRKRECGVSNTRSAPDRLERSNGNPALGGLAYANAPRAFHDADVINPGGGRGLLDRRDASVAEADQAAHRFIIFGREDFPSKAPVSP